MQKTTLRKPFALSAAACLGLLLCAFSTMAAPPQKQAAPAAKTKGLVVHEWGTFLSVQGSDGKALGGMVESDEALPPFVEVSSPALWQQRSMLFQKMETPVTYFYSIVPRTVQVRVDMPKGLLTHWFPAVSRFGPGPEGKAAVKDSFLAWQNIKVIPTAPAGSRDAATLAAGLKRVGEEQTWRFVRDTDSASLQILTRNAQGKQETQYEKFLFYRGLGGFQLPLAVRSASAGDRTRLTIQNPGAQTLRSLFAVAVEGGLLQVAALGDLGGNASREVDLSTLFSARRPLAEGVAQAKNDVAAGLISAGLFPKEAQAMVNTWERSYFKTDGLRLLYLLPTQVVDHVIPIKIIPEPEKLVRVMVGRVEVLTPQREKQIEGFVAQLGATDFKVRDAATRGLAQLGRLGEPALRRVLATTSDPEVRFRAESLINRVVSSN
jgi:hypothetical protein